MFERLLVSSPNGGGIFLVDGEDVIKLDSIDTTGLFFSEEIIARCAQPDSLIISGAEPKFIDGVGADFDDVHDILFFEDCFYLVGTMGNEIIRFSRLGQEIERWVYPGEQDSWHINCLTVWNGRIVFSAFGEFSRNREYKGRSKGAGFVQDIISGERIITGLSQPHSLHSFGDRLLVANSEEKELVVFSPAGRRLHSIGFSGYPRGVSVDGAIAYVGISCSRNIDSAAIEMAEIIAVDLNKVEVLGVVKIPSKEIYSIVQVGSKESISHAIQRVFSTTLMVYEKKHQILMQENVEVRGKLEEREIRLLEVESQLAELYKSPSWRLTKPLRAIGSLTKK